MDYNKTQAYYDGIKNSGKLLYDEDWLSGDGIMVYIKDNKIVFDGVCEGGYSGCSFAVDLEEFKNKLKEV